MVWFIFGIVWLVLGIILYNVFKKSDDEDVEKASNPVFIAGLVACFVFCMIGCFCSVGTGHTGIIRQS